MVEQALLFSHMSQVTSTSNTTTPTTTQQLQQLQQEAGKAPRAKRRALTWIQFPDVKEQCSDLMMGAILLGRCDFEQLLVCRSTGMMYGYVYTLL